MSKRIGWASLLVVVLAFLLTQSCSHKQSDAFVVDEAFYARVEIVNFSRQEEALIREAMRPLASPRCNRAFVRAGLRSPLEVIQRDGIVVRPSSDLYRFTLKELGLADERTRQAYKYQFSSGNAQAGTVSPVIGGTRRTLDGRARLFLFDTAFYESFIFRRLSLRGVVVHEFVHLTGRPPVAGRLGFLQHDLAGFEPYNEIMEACR